MRIIPGSARVVKVWTGSRWTFHVTALVWGGISPQQVICFDVCEAEALRRAQLWNKRHPGRVRAP